MSKITPEGLQEKLQYMNLEEGMRITGMQGIALFMGLINYSERVYSSF